MNTDEHEADYAIFGRIVLLWGHVESALNNLILTLAFAPFASSKRKGIPQPFFQKCELACRGLETIEAMRPIRRHGIATIESLAPFHELRSVIVHGCFRGRSNKGYEFALYNPKKRQLEIKILSEGQPAALAQKIVELRDRLEHMAMEADGFREKWQAEDK